MNLYTIGFVKKSAEEFFSQLIKNNVKRVIDIRLNNKSQLAGYTKNRDLKYFLSTIGDIDYIHKVEFAPTKELLTSYKKKLTTWDDYEKKYNEILEERKILEDIDYALFDNACLLCSEPTAQNCHRRLLAEYLERHNKSINVVHLK